MSTTSLMTFAEFLELPDVEGERRELIDGELVTMPPPELDHTRIAQRFYRLFFAVFGEDRAWGERAGYRVGGGWLEPDVSVSWPHQRRDGKYFLGSPMIAVEVLSPRQKLERKLTLYFAEGALEVWIADRDCKAMTVYVKKGEDVVRIAVDREYHSAAIGLTIPLAEIFA